MIGENEALVNVTWAGQNGDLPDPVAYDATDGDIRQWVTEAVRAGGIPGIGVDEAANFGDFIVDRFPATAAEEGDEGEKPNRIMIRPKTPFGALWRLIVSKIRPSHKARHPRPFRPARILVRPKSPF